MKKFLSIALVLTMMVMIFSGCSNKKEVSIEKNNIEDNEENNNKEIATLKFWTWYPAESIWQEAIDVFEKENPNIKIDLTVMSSLTYQEKLPVALATGEELDVMGIQTNNMVNQLKTYLEPMEQAAKEYIDKEWKDKFLLSDIEACENKSDDIYFLPIGKTGSPIIYYNAKVFSELGLKEPKTYEDFKKVVSTIREKRSDIMPLSFNGKETWFTDEIVWALVGETSDLYNQIRYGDGRFQRDKKTPK